MRRFNSAILASVLLLIGGCGGSGTSVQSGSNAQLAFAIEWPSQSRFIHQSATHIVVSAKVNNIPIALTGTPDQDANTNTLTIVRPDPGQSITSSQVSMTGLPSGPLTFTVESFRTGESKALGKAVVPVVLVPGKNANLEFVLESQTAIVEVRLTPSKTIYNVAEEIDLSAVSKQANGAIVIDGGNNFSYSVSDSSKLQFLSDTRVKVLAPGTCQVTATETGNDSTGRQGSTTVSLGSFYNYRVIESDRIVRPVAMDDAGRVYGEWSQFPLTGPWRLDHTSHWYGNLTGPSFVVTSGGGGKVGGYYASNFSGQFHNFDFQSPWTPVNPRSPYQMAFPVHINAGGDALILHQNPLQGSGVAPELVVLLSSSGESTDLPLIGTHLSRGGTVSGSIRGEGFAVFEPATWKNGGLDQLPRPDGSNQCRALMAADDGTVVVQGAGSSKFIWRSGQYVDQTSFNIQDIASLTKIVASESLGTGASEAWLYSGSNWQRIDELLPPDCVYEARVPIAISTDGAILIECRLKANPNSDSTYLIVTPPG